MALRAPAQALASAAQHRHGVRADTSGPAAGLVVYCESAGIFADGEDWRIPDQVYARSEHEIDEGLVGAELVVEVRSPDDESYAKLPFYAARGITEAVIVHRDRRFDLYRLDQDGAYQRVEDGRSTVLGVTFATLDGPKLGSPGPTAAEV